MIDVAIEAAKAAGDLAYRYFKTKPKVAYKSDNSPVTRADIETEKLIRKIITKKFPDHGIIGEELPPVNPKAKYQWVIDPIDGTKQFIRGLPFWATLIALLEKGRPIIGISYQPTMNEIFTAQQGKGSFRNGKRTKVSQIKDLKKSYCVYGAPNFFEIKGKLKGLVKLTESVSGRRGYSDAYGFNLLISGKIDINVVPTCEMYDIAAAAILVTEAGGKFSDFDGNFSLTSGNAVATNDLLHNQVLKILNG